MNKRSVYPSPVWFDGISHMCDLTLWITRIWFGWESVWFGAFHHTDYWKRSKHTDFQKVGGHHTDLLKNKSHRLPKNYHTQITQKLSHRFWTVVTKSNRKTNSIIFSQQQKMHQIPTWLTHKIMSMKLTHMKSSIYTILLNILHQSNYGKYEAPTM
jgi:hypothetical protein